MRTLASISKLAFVPLKLKYEGERMIKHRRKDKYERLVKLLRKNYLNYEADNMEKCFWIFATGCPIQYARALKLMRR